MQRNLGFAVAAAISIVGVVGMGTSAAAEEAPATTAEAPATTAKAPAFEVFEHDDFKGGGAAFRRDARNLANLCWPGGGCRVINDNISSMDNDLDRDVVMWSNANFGGIPYYAQPNSEDKDLTNNNFDNKASSIDIR